MFMDDKQTTITKDRAAILELGGPAAVAGLLGYDKTSGGIQRVQNWMKRGIPAQVKLDRPDVFPRAPINPRKKYGRRSTDKKSP